MNAAPGAGDAARERTGRRTRSSLGTVLHRHRSQTLSARATRSAQLSSSLELYHSSSARVLFPLA
jgi:hypothetical protein